MDYLELIYLIPAAVAASVMFVNVLPFSVDKKLNPWIMFAAAMLVLFLPQWMAIALAMTIPMGLIYGWTGIRLQGHEPVRVPVQEVRATIAKLRPPKKTEVQAFLTKEYPDPDLPPEQKFVPEL